MYIDVCTAWGKILLEFIYYVSFVIFLNTVLLLKLHFMSSSFGRIVCPLPMYGGHLQTYLVYYTVRTVQYSTDREKKSTAASIFSPLFLLAHASYLNMVVACFGLPMVLEHNEEFTAKGGEEIAA